MHRLGRNVEDALESRGRDATGLLHEKRHGVRLVKEAQLSTPILGVGRVAKYPPAARQKCVDIRHKSAAILEVPSRSAGAVTCGGIGSCTRGK